MLTIGSLFAGIGGLELGLEWSGLGRVRWQVERDPFCRSVLVRNWPYAERFDDVCTVGSHCLCPADVICGGFPCQDVSGAGKGAGLDGARSGLWREFRRIVEELRPRVAIVENVASGKARWLCQVRTDLHALGYSTTAYALSAADVGAPHRRARIFAVAYADGDGCEGVRRRRKLDTGERAQLGHDADRRGSARGEQEHSGPTAEPRVGGGAHGLSAGVDRRPTREPLWPSRRGQPQHAWEPPRAAYPGPYAAERLNVLGNAVVPQVAEVVGRIVAATLAPYSTRR